MTDTTTVTPAAPTTPAVPASEPTAPAAPAPEPTAPAAPAAPPTAPSGPLSKREARRAPLPAKSEEPAPTEPAPTEPAPTGEPAAAPEPAPAAPTPPTPAEPAPEAIAVDIPADHPAARGRATTIKVQSEEEARVLKALRNGSYTRRQELAALQQRTQDLENELARRDAEHAARARWQGTDEYKQAQEHHQNLVQLEADGSVPAGTAENYRLGVERGLQPLLEEETRTRTERITEERQQRAAQQWAQEAWEDVNEAIPEFVRTLPQYGTIFQRALQSFDSELQLGHLPQIRTRADMLPEFQKFFRVQLSRDDGVKAALRARKQEQDQQEAARKAAADDQARIASDAKAVEEFKRAAAAKRQQLPPHPLGNLHGVSRDRVPSDQEDQGAPPVPTNPHQLRKLAKAGAREDARRRYSGP